MICCRRDADPAFLCLSYGKGGFLPKALFQKLKIAGAFVRKTRIIRVGIIVHLGDMEGIKYRLPGKIKSLNLIFDGKQLFCPEVSHAADADIHFPA